MEKLFLMVLRMSGTAALVIAAVLLARLALRKAPKIFSYALWAVALFRLLCPVSVSSGFSLLPAVQTQPAGAGQTSVHIHTGISAMNSQVNDYLTHHPYPVEFTPSGREGDIGAVYLDGVSRMVGTAAPDWVSVACWVWLAGAALLLGYGALSALRLRRRLAASLPLEGEENVRLADHIPSPFVWGLARPRIYLPSGLPEGERDYILLHERTHIRRGDHLFRALAWLALAVHWFNPLVWLAFCLAGKDMEMSCDEAVLRKMGRDVRADYSSSLLRLSAGGRLPAGPLAFGGGAPQSRIKNVLNYKKPALWVIVAALIVVLCAGVALATNPGSFSGPGKPADFVFHEPGPAEVWLDYTDAPQDMPWGDGVRAIQLPEYPGVAFRWTPGQVAAAGEKGDLVLFEGMPIWSVYLCDLDGDGKRELCAEVSFGSGMVDNRVLVFNYEYLSLLELKDRGTHDYTLRLEGGQLWAEEREYNASVGPVLRAGPLVMTEEGLDIQAASAAITLPEADLALSLEEAEDGTPLVRVEGSVDGTPLTRNAVWWAQGMETLFDGHSSGLSLRCQFDGVWAETSAWWANEERTAVTLSTKMSALVSSRIPAGYWTVTVALSGEGGTVTDRTLHNLDEREYPVDQFAHPANIPDGDAVQAARAAAKLLVAAEDFYLGRTGVQDAPASSEQLPPYFRLDSIDRVVIEGVGEAFVEWDAPGSLYFEGDASYFLPRRLQPYELDGYASWTDGTRRILLVSLTQADAGVSGEFTLEVDSAAAVWTKQEGEGGLLDMTQHEMVETGNAISTLMLMAEDFYFGGTQGAPGGTADG